MSLQPSDSYVYTAFNRRTQKLQPRKMLAMCDDGIGIVLFLGEPCALPATHIAIRANSIGNTPHSDVSTWS
eukprot:SAG11_NODE_1010_length_6199_cov_2.572131_8_plen_71_part_00